MADAKITALDENTTPASTDLTVIVDDPGSTPATQKMTLDTLDDYLSASTKTLTNKTLTNPVVNFTDTAVAQNVLVRVYNSSTQSITQGSFVKLQFNTEDFDIGSDWDTSNYRFTAPVTGYYQVNAGIIYDNVTDGKFFYLAIFVNGSEYATSITQAAGATSDPNVTVSGLVYCASGQYIEFYTYNEDTTARIVKTGQNRNWGDIHLVSI